MKMRTLPTLVRRIRKLTLLRLTLKETGLMMRALMLATKLTRIALTK